MSGLDEDDELITPLAALEFLTATLVEALTKLHDDVTFIRGKILTAYRIERDLD